MSLHDTDKSNLDRGTPTPNSADHLIGPQKNHGTLSIHPVSDATTSKAFLQTKSGRILANDGNNNIGLFGFDSTGAMVVKVAKPGFNADTTSNANLVFNSSQDVFKIVSTGNTTLTLNTTYTSKNSPSATVSVAHGLSAIPALIAYFGMNNNNFPGVVTGTQYSMPYVTFGGSYRFGFSIDATNINFHYYNDSGSTADFSSTSCTATFKYYILQETAS